MECAFEASRRKHADQPTSFLCTLQEISEETGVPTSELRLGRDNLERALMARLMEGGVSNEWPLHYLMASYNRLSEELRSLNAIRDQDELSRMTSTLIYGKQLTVSYSGLLLNMDMFPQVLLCQCNACLGALAPFSDKPPASQTADCHKSQLLVVTRLLLSGVSDDCPGCTDACVACSKASRP